MQLLGLKLSPPALWQLHHHPGPGLGLYLLSAVVLHQPSPEKTGWFPTQTEAQRLYLKVSFTKANDREGTAHGFPVILVVVG